MDHVFKFSHEIKICNAYANYLSSASAESETKTLIEVLDENNLLAHAAALQALQMKGEGWIKALPISKPWQNMACYVGVLPPENAELGTLWFDPYELSFMARIMNLPWTGGTQGWIAIEPVTVWQYQVFLKLSKREKVENPFLMVNDLFADRNFSQSSKPYITNIYQIEADLYSRWHGKRTAGKSRFTCALNFFTPDQLECLYPKDYYFFDPAASGAEELCGFYKCDAFRGKTREEILEQMEVIVKSIEVGSDDEWLRSKQHTMLIHLSDELGLTLPKHYPLDDDYMKLLNCSRKI